METDTRYNGWTNYETWAVKLWIDNEQGDYEYWREATRNVIETCRDKYPNEFADKEANERILLGQQLKDWHEEAAESFMANQASVFADLMNAALGAVEWNEIAQSMLEDEREETQ
jgi:hypothetical protein